MVLSPCVSTHTYSLRISTTSSMGIVTPPERPASPMLARAQATRGKGAGPAVTGVSRVGPWARSPPPSLPIGVWDVYIFVGLSNKLDVKGRKNLARGEPVQRAHGAVVAPTLAGS